MRVADIVVLYFLNNNTKLVHYTFRYTTLFRSSAANSQLRASCGDSGKAFESARGRPEGHGRPRGRQRRCWRGISAARDRKSTRLNSSHRWISYAALCLKKNRCTSTTPAETTGN